MTEAKKLALRPEVRSLDSQQLKRLIDVIQALKQQGNFDHLAHLYEKSFPTVGNSPQFLPWNRHFLRQFEMTLQRLDPSLTLPFWDWSQDAKDPARSPILSAQYFGGNGSGSDGAVADGPFAGWTCAYPKPHKLERRFNQSDGSISPFPDPDRIEALLAAETTYDQFRRNIALGLAGAPHLGIGGDMRTAHAPNDPLFFVHRAFIDLLWHEWQQRHPSKATTYDGEGSGGRPASANDRLNGFDVPVRQVLDTTAQAYAYPPLVGTQHLTHPSRNRLLTSVHDLFSTTSPPWRGPASAGPPASSWPNRSAN
ncbi:tyrosinase family protein [Streptomyces sp. NPDC002120]|uniref:tyrosinase family protein n=1 Tax=Streptomyces sp. NPDC002120 TaxID=3364631 RepID=UPI0036C36128